MIMDGALGFLKLCADHPGNGFAPSKMVDIGWHTFLMYTREYQEFCQEVAGRFIHHAPNDGEVKKTGVVARTVGFMLAENLAFNGAMWSIKASDCNVDCTDSCNRCSDNSCTECNHE